MLSITTSGTSLDWLQERGQRHALREGFDIYLERGFGMRDAGHVNLDEIVPNMSAAHAAQALARVTEAASKICGLLSPLDLAKRSLPGLSQPLGPS